MNLNNFTIKAQEAIAQSQQLAFNHQNPNIETEHLLKALLSDEDSSIEFLLKKKFGRLNGWVGYTLSKTERKFDDINDGDMAREHVAQSCRSRGWNSSNDLCVA